METKQEWRGYTEQIETHFLIACVPNNTLECEVRKVKMVLLLEQIVFRLNNILFIQKSCSLLHFYIECCANLADIFVLMGKLVESARIWRFIHKIGIIHLRETDISIRRHVSIGVSMR